MAAVRKRKTPIRNGEHLAGTKLLDSALANEALRKLKSSGKPTVRQSDALRKREREANARDLPDLLHKIPKKYWIEGSGRQSSQVNRQAQRYGIPIGGATIDLYAVAHWLHDFLAKHARKFAAPEGEEDGMFGPSTPWLEKYRKERALLARLERKEREGELLPREKVHEFVTELATILRGASDRLERRFGADALEIINEALDNYDARAERHFANLEAQAEEVEEDV